MLAACFLAGCTEDQQIAASAPNVHVGLRRVTQTPVDWELVSQNLVVSVYRCKPSACAKPAIVAFKMRPPRIRQTDPQALEHFALVDVPKNFLADDAGLRIESDGKKHEVLLTSRAGSTLGRPAVLIEAKRTVDGKTAFVAIDEIFVGSIQLQVTSTANTLEQAHANLDVFLASTTLTDSRDA